MVVVVAVVVEGKKRKKHNKNNDDNNNHNNTNNGIVFVRQKYPLKYTCRFSSVALHQKSTINNVWTRPKSSILLVENEIRDPKEKMWI